MSCRLAVLATLVSMFGSFSITAQEPAATGKQIVSPPGYDLGLPFSPAVWSDDLLFLSGAIGNPPGKVEVSGDVEAQTRQTLKNLNSVLHAADLDLSRVVSMNIYLSDLRQFPTFWKTLLRELDGHTPAGAAVEADIAIPGARLEASMVAAKPGVEIRSIQPKGWLDPGAGGKWAMMAGNVLFTSGMASINPATGEFVTGDFASQTRLAMDNVGQILKAAGLDWDSVVRCRVFLPDPNDYGPMNDVYGSFMTSEPPSRATVRARLLHPEARFGVQCIAVDSDDRKVVRAKDAAPSTRPFSPAIQADGRLYLAGMVGRGADGFPHGVEAQTRITLQNLEATLRAAGLTFDDVVEATVYLSDARFYSAMNDVYREVLGKYPPARATVGMPLMSPDALVEIQMTADVGDDPSVD